MLAQPVMELCLSLPTSRLTAGGRDRGLARQAFAGRLPDSVRLRQSKGELGAYYGQVAAASLPMLRDYLLDGELVRAGLLDRARLEPMLVRDHLIWRGDYSALMSFAVVEAWVRHWADRLAAARGAHCRRSGPDCLVEHRATSPARSLRHARGQPQVQAGRLYTTGLTIY